MQIAYFLPLCTAVEDEGGKERELHLHRHEQNVSQASKTSRMIWAQKNVINSRTTFENAVAGSVSSGLRPGRHHAHWSIDFWKKSFHRPSTINEVWFQSLIRKTGYPASLTYLNRLFLVSCWF
jgi:hypothetical protein